MQWCLALCVAVDFNWSSSEGHCVLSSVLWSELHPWDLVIFTHSFRMSKNVDGKTITVLQINYSLQISMLLLSDAKLVTCEWMYRPVQYHFSYLSRWFWPFDWLQFTHSDRALICKRQENNNLLIWSGGYLLAIAKNRQQVKNRASIL